MPQNATLRVSDPPTTPPTDDLNVDSGILKKPTAGTSTDDLNLESGLVSRTNKATGKSASKESNSLWNKAWTGLVTPEQATKAVTFGIPIPKPEEYAKQAAKYRREGHPAYAALSDLEGYTSSFYKTTGEVASSLTSPAQLGLMAITAGGSEAEQAGYQVLARVARIPGKAIGLWFGGQGLKIASTPQQADENRYDAFWRRTLGMSAFLGTAHDTVTSSAGAFRNVLKKQFKTSDDLAAKVATQVNQIDQVRRQAAATKSAIGTATSQEVRALQDHLQTQLSDIQQNSFTRVTAIRAQAEQAIEQNKGKITDLQKQRLRQGAETVADTMQAFLQEKDRVSKPFDEIDAEIKGNVAKQDEVRGVIETAFRDTGVDVAQIPSRAVELLKAPEEGGSRLTGATLRTPDGHYLEVDQQYVPGFIEKGYKIVGDVSPEGAVTFDRITRIREDVSQAANASKDTRVKAALLKGHDSLTDFQEKIAEKHGLGPKYKRAKNNYKIFKRGIGSDMVETFLDAADAESQALAPKIAELTTKQNAEALRTVLKASGVDTGPLDQIIKNIDAVNEEIGQTERLASTMVSETEKSATKAAAGARVATREEIAAKKKAGSQQGKVAEKVAQEQVSGIKKEPIIPGQDVETLIGKTNRDLLEARIRQQMNTAHGGGFVNTWALTSIVFGLMETVRGSFYGPLLVTKGVLLMKLPSLMREAKFQDWVIRQTGLQPRSAQGIRLRKGIAALGPILRKSLKSGVPQAAAVKAAQQLSVPEVPGR